MNNNPSEEELNEEENEIEEETEGESEVDDENDFEGEIIEEHLDSSNRRRRINSVAQTVSRKTAHDRVHQPIGWR